MKRHYFVTYIIDSNIVNGHQIRNTGWMHLSCMFWKKDCIPNEVMKYIDKRLIHLQKEHGRPFSYTSINVSKL